MKICRTVTDMQAYIKANKQSPIGFVPTMGCLHQGHLKLVKASTSNNNITVVSIFVNPTQFGPNEDFNTYPKTFEADIEACKQAGADVVFYPSINDMYPSGKEGSTEIYVPQLSTIMCGKTRKNFFKGVCTVVARLFQIVQPTNAYFGEKDFQQLVIIKKMTNDLFFPIHIHAVATERDKHGLALSSRNRYLSQADYKNALTIYKTFRYVLRNASQVAKQPKQAPADVGHIYKNTPSFTDPLISHCENLLTQAGFNVDYFDIRNQNTLEKEETLSEHSRVFFGGYLGKTRLIDNMFVGI